MEPQVSEMFSPHSSPQMSTRSLPGLPPIPSLPGLTPNSSPVKPPQIKIKSTFPQLGDLPPIEVEHPVYDDGLPYIGDEQKVHFGMITIPKVKQNMYEAFPNPDKRPNVWVATIVLFDNDGMMEDLVTHVAATRFEAGNCVITTLMGKWELVHKKTQEVESDPGFYKMAGVDEEDIDRSNGELTISEWLEQYWSATAQPDVTIEEHEVV